MRIVNAKKIAEQYDHVLEYSNSLRLYILSSNEPNSPQQWFPGSALKDMSESTFKYFYLRVDLDEVLGDDVPERG